MRVDRLAARFIGIAAASALALAGCGRRSEAPPQPPVEVGVVTVQPTPVPLTTELPGRTNPYLVAEVRARVDGIVLRREFTEGSAVKAGQRLYKIDPAPYQAQLDTAQAQLAKAQATLASAAALAQRYKVLVATNAISKQDYDNAVAAAGQAAADVAAGKAAVETARIALGYTDVVAPISGRIGKSAVTPGAYVQASQATLLATIQQIDPIYVDVTQSSVDGLKLRQAVARGDLQAAGGAAPVALLLEDGSRYPHDGKLQFSDITVDPGTGMIDVRALFPNPDGLLLPGMFVRARLTEGVDRNAMRVPQIGVAHDQKGQPTALVVGAGDKVELRQLVASRTLDHDWIVEGGLAPGDRVIVQGVQKVKPGETVKAVDAQLPEAAAAASAASAAGAR